MRVVEVAPEPFPSSAAGDIYFLVLVTEALPMIEAARVALYLYWRDAARRPIAPEPDKVRQYRIGTAAALGLPAETPAASLADALLKKAVQVAGGIWKDAPAHPKLVQAAPRKVAPKASKKAKPARKPKEKIRDINELAHRLVEGATADPAPEKAEPAVSPAGVSAPEAAPDVDVLTRAQRLRAGAN